MNKPEKIISLIVILILFSILPVAAQDFKWESSVDAVSQKGYYNIILQPEIVAKLNHNFGDIRIYDEEKNEIPYILQHEKRTSRRTLFKEYEIIEKKHYRNRRYTRLVIHNPDKNPITNISLIIRNADVTKWLKLNASDNNKDWYVLKDHYRFHSFASDAGTHEIKVLNFPNSNYEYYELLIEDYFDNPINILKAGYYDYSIETGKYSELPLPFIYQEDSSSNKRSNININFAEKVYFDRLEFDIEGAEYYYRKASVYVKRTTKKKRKVQTYHDHVINFEVGSFKENYVDFDRYAASKLHLNILNNDDKPLKIKSIKALLLNRYLTAELSPEHIYYLRFGENDVAAPIYDLEYFADSISLQQNAVKTQQIKQLTITDDSENEEGKIPAYVIWLALGAIILILGYMSYKMLTEMQKK